MPLLILRFVVFALICCGIVFWWATRAGHGGMGIVAGGIFASWAAPIAWGLAILAERRAGQPLVRLGVHVVVTVVVFVVIAFFIFWYLDSGLSYYTGDWDFILPLGSVVAFAAVIDGIVGMAAPRKAPE